MGNPQWFMGVTNDHTLMISLTFLSMPTYMFIDQHAKYSWKC